MRLGVVILPEHRWSEAAGLWRRAEELGFAHAWTYDHLTWRSLRDGPWFATVPTLAAAAVATERIRLGTLVASPNFRHPVPFAKELMTLDDLSAGRLVLGIGAGGRGFDASALGQEPWPVGERAERFAEFVGLTDRILRRRETDFSGRFYSAVAARSIPGCVQQPRIPFAVAAGGARAMEVVAAYGDSWVTLGAASPDELEPPERGAAMVAEQTKRLEQACAEHGRDVAGIGRILLSGFSVSSGLESVESFRDALGRYGEVGITDFVVHWPRAGEPFAGERSHFEEVVGEVLAGKVLG